MAHQRDGDEGGQQDVDGAVREADGEGDLDVAAQHQLLQHIVHCSMDERKVSVPCAAQAHDGQTQIRLLQSSAVVCCQPS